jgi:hypothetical protein
MKDWLASPQIRADTNVLSQMQEFALSVKSSKTMSELANQLVQMIELRVRLNLSLLTVIDSS